MTRWAAPIVSATLAATGCGTGWRQLPPLPDREGFAGSFAGASHGALLVAGGANFPLRRPWEGGTKAWHDDVFVLEAPGAGWKAAGKLPHPLAYGVSVTHRDGVVCVGGSDASRHHADAFRLEWKGGRLVTSGLPPLPVTLANCCGALVGEVLYVAGGQVGPDSLLASNRAWRMDLSAATPAWEEIEPCPGDGRGRMLAIATGFDGSFWMVGGVELVEGKGPGAGRRYLADGYRYDPRGGWKRIGELPSPVAAAPSPAPFDSTGLYLLGGDDGSQVGVAPDRHRGFSTRVLRYDAMRTRWHEVGELPAPRATVPCVPWDGSWVVPSGEVRPGVRSPEVWAWSPVP